MPLPFACKKCGQKFQIPEHLAGKRAKCRHCGSLFLVPQKPTEARERPIENLGLHDTDNNLAGVKLPSEQCGSTRRRAESRDRSIEFCTPRFIAAGLLSLAALVAGVSFLVNYRARSDAMPLPEPPVPEMRADNQDEEPKPSGPEVASFTPDSTESSPAQSVTPAHAFGLIPPFLEAPIPEDRRARIAELEAQLAANPRKFDWSAYNELRHLYGGFSPRRAAYHGEVILANSIYDDYMLGTMGAFGVNDPRAPSLLLEWTANFPEYRRAAAACRLKAAELMDDPTRAASLLAEVERIQGDDVAPYRALVETIRARIAASETISGKEDAAAQRDPVTAVEAPSSNAAERQQEPTRYERLRPTALLSSLRDSGKTQLADDLERAFNAAVADLESVRGKVQGHVVMGIVELEGRGDPREAIFWNADILEGGYFITSVAQGKPLRFKALGYEPMSVQPQGASDTLEDIGRIRLRRLSPAKAVTIRGNVTLEGRPTAEGAWARIWLGAFDEDSLTTASGRPLWNANLSPAYRESQLVAKVDPAGNFALRNVPPGKHGINVDAEGYMSTRVSVTGEPGWTVLLDPVELKLPYVLTFTSLTAAKPPFPKTDPITNSCTTLNPWEIHATVADPRTGAVIDNSRQGRIRLLQEGVTVRTAGWRPATASRIAELGDGSLNHYLDVDPARVTWQVCSDLEPIELKNDHVYLLEMAWGERVGGYVLTHVTIAKPSSAPPARQRDTKQSHIEYLLSLPGQPVLISPPTGRSIPLNDRQRAIISVLQTEANAPEEAIPFHELLLLVQKSTVQPPMIPSGLPIYNDPAGMRDLGKRDGALVALNGRRESVGNLLLAAVKQLGLDAYIQRDGVIIISSPPRIERFRRMPDTLHDGSLPSLESLAEIAPLKQPIRRLSDKARPAIEALMLPISMPFSQPTSISDVFRYINAATMNPKLPAGLSIEIDDATVKHTPELRARRVSLKLEGIPLGTSLYLIADQLDLAPYLEADRRVVLKPRPDDFKERRRELE